MYIITQFNFLVLFLCFISHSLSVPPPTTPTENIVDIDTKTDQNCGISLDLSNLNLGPYVSDNFISSPHVKNLTLRENNINGFSEGAFDSIPNLEYLDLSYNKLEFDKRLSLGQLLNLKVLILDGNTYDSNSYYTTTDTTTPLYDEKYDYNRYQRIPESNITPILSARVRKILQLTSSYKFSQMRHLSLRRTNIEDISTISNLTFPNLSYLDLSENNLNRNVLNDIPSTVTTLIMENSGFTDFELKSLTNLRILNVNGNNFNTVGRYCYSNTLCLQGSQLNLQKLYINRCSINKIEVDAFKDVSNLLELDLSNNKLVQLTDGTLENVKSLNRLDLSYNPLLVVPDLSVLENLTTLILDGMTDKKFFNSLLSLNLPKLNTLSMRNNYLKVIPEDLLNNLQLLQELDLSNNIITMLPAWQWQSTLCKLNVSFNSIESFDDVSLNEAKALKVLDITANKISNIKVKAIKNFAHDAIITI